MSTKVNLIALEQSCLSKAASKIASSPNQCSRSGEESGCIRMTCQLCRTKFPASSELRLCRESKPLDRVIAVCNFDLECSHWCSWFVFGALSSQHPTPAQKSRRVSRARCKGIGCRIWRVSTTWWWIRLSRSSWVSPYPSWCTLWGGLWKARWLLRTGRGKLSQTRIRQRLAKRCIRG